MTTLDNTLNGTIHTTLEGLNIYFENGNYYVTDGVNDWYLCNYKKRAKLFSFYASNEVQFLGYKSFVDAFNKAFKRKPVLWL